MEEARVIVYGKNSEAEPKRAFDLIRQGKQCFVESKDRYGRRILTPIEVVRDQYRKLMDNNNIA